MSEKELSEIEERANDCNAVGDYITPDVVLNLCAEIRKARELIRELLESTDDLIEDELVYKTEQFLKGERG